MLSALEGPLESTTFLGSSTVKFPPFALGLRTSASVVLSLSANIPTSLPPLMLYFIGKVFPVGDVRTYRLVKPVLLKLAVVLLLIVGVGVPAVIIDLLPVVTTVAAAPGAAITTVLLASVCCWSFTVPFAVGALAVPFAVGALLFRLLLELSCSNVRIVGRRVLCVCYLKAHCAQENDQSNGHDYNSGQSD